MASTVQMLATESRLAQILVMTQQLLRLPQETRLPESVSLFLSLGSPRPFQDTIHCLTNNTPPLKENDWLVSLALKKLLGDRRQRIIPIVLEVQAQVERLRLQIAGGESACFEPWIIDAITVLKIHVDAWFCLKSGQRISESVSPVTSGLQPAISSFPAADYGFPGANGSEYL